MLKDNNEDKNKHKAILMTWVFCWKFGCDVTKMGKITHIQISWQLFIMEKNIIVSVCALVCLFKKYLHQESSMNIILGFDVLFKETTGESQYVISEIKHLYLCFINKKWIKHGYTFFISILRWQDRLRLYNALHYFLESLY